MKQIEQILVMLLSACGRDGDPSKRAGSQFCGRRSAESGSRLGGDRGHSIGSRMSFSGTADSSELIVSFSREVNVTSEPAADTIAGPCPSAAVREGVAVCGGDVTEARADIAD